MLDAATALPSMTNESVGMAPKDGDGQKIFMEVTQEKEAVAVPLIQIEALEVDEAIQSAIVLMHDRLLYLLNRL